MRWISKLWDWANGRKPELNREDVEDITESVLDKVKDWLKNRFRRGRKRTKSYAPAEPTRLRTPTARTAIMEEPSDMLPRELLQGLRHPDGDKRRAAALALGQRGEAAREAIPLLLPVLADTAPEVRKAAREALERIDPEWSKNPLAAEAVPALLDVLGNRSYEVVQAASAVLQQIGHAAVPALISLLADDAKEMRQVAAAQTLGRIGCGEREVIAELSRALKSEKSLVRRTAAEALGQLGPAAELAVFALAPLLGDWNVSVRQAAAKCLGQVGLSAAPTVPHLCRLLAEEDESTREVAMDSLAKIGLIAVPLLMEMLERRNVKELEEWMRLQSETGDWLTRVDTAASSWNPERALRNLSWQFQQSLVELEQRTRRLHQNVATTLGRIGPGAAPAVTILVRALDDEDSGLRLAAIRALGRIGPAALPAVPGLVGKLADGRESHRKAAIEALPKIKTSWATSSEARRALSGLVEAMKSRGSDSGQAALDALVSMGGSAVPALAEGLRSSDRVIRESSAEALGKIGKAAKDAVPALRKALEDEHGWVRAAAEQALKQVEDSPAS